MISLHLLNRIVDIWDPAGLMDFSPPDEYSGFARNLQNRIGDDYSFESISNSLVKQYDAEFGYTGIPMPTCEYAAQLIYHVAHGEIFEQ